MKRNGSNRLTTIIIIVLVVAGGWRYWHKQIRPRVIPRRFGVVEQGQLYRSGKIHPRLLRKVVEKNGIEAIVSLSGRYEPDEIVAEELSLELSQYYLFGDGTGDIRVYADAIEDIVRANNRGKPVLVHCAAGTMRTGAAVAFYRMLVQGQQDSELILRELKKYDWKTKQNMLPQYVNRNMYTLARILKDRGVIRAIPDPIPQLKAEGVRIYSFDELRALDTSLSSERIAQPAQEAFSHTAPRDGSSGRI